MITLKHSVNLITEIDEFAMPAELLNVFLSLDESQLEKMLRGAFLHALVETGFLDTINEDNQWATVKIGDN